MWIYDRWYKRNCCRKKFPLTLNYDNFYKIKIDKINKKYENISEEFWNKAYKSVKNKKHDALQDALDEIYWNDKHNGKWSELM